MVFDFSHRYARERREARSVVCVGRLLSAFIPIQDWEWKGEFETSWEMISGCFQAFPYSMCLTRILQSLGVYCSPAGGEVHLCRWLRKCLVSPNYDGVEFHLQVGRFILVCCSYSEALPKRGLETKLVCKSDVCDCWWMLVF